VRVPERAGVPAVLLVEDDRSLGAGVVGLLAGEGHAVRWAQDGATARRLASEQRFDLVLLDLGLPDADGVDLCVELRAAQPDLVIVVVTARTAELDAVRALDSGADDVVLKPFRPVELLARLRAHLRRREPVAGADEVRCGAVRLDLRGRRAWVDAIELTLRPKEHELLAALMAEAGQAVRREQLMDQVWDEHWHGSTKTLDVHVANLRRKLADAGERWDRITTLRGFGYRYEVDAPP
jgi:DNA-binding response OmpR family regulator